LPRNHDHHDHYDDDHDDSAASQHDDDHYEHHDDDHYEHHDYDHDSAASYDDHHDYDSGSGYDHYEHDDDSAAVRGDHYARHWGCWDVFVGSGGQRWPFQGGLLRRDERRPETHELPKHFVYQSRGPDCPGQ